MEERLLIGVIVKARGLKGEVAVKAFSEILNPEGLIKEVIIEPKEGAVYTSQIENVRFIGQGNLGINFKGLNNRTQAEALKGAKITLTADNLPLLEADSYYVKDLMGLSAYSEGEKIGVVTDILDNPGNDILIISGEDKKEQLIPLVKARVPKISLEERYLEVIILAEEE